MSEEVITKNQNPYLVPGAIVFAGLCIALAVILTRPTTPQANPVESAELEPEVLPVTESDHVRGSRDAKVFLIEYSDYKCGYCGLFHDTLTQLLEEYEGDVAWVYRHTPYQPGGKEAAIASECIAEQLGEDAFWSYTDKAFENQRALSDAWHVETAVELGADRDAFTECVSSGKYEELISTQTLNAQTLGGRGTPYNVLLTKEGKIIKFSGAQPIENVKIFVERALKSLE